jgi:signal transduction histidine kinase
MRVVSHEFRTPLAVIRNAIDMIGLVGDKSPEATRERLSGIGEALNRLFSLIDRFMTDDRESSFQPELLQMGSIIGDAQLHFEMTARGERLHFTIDDAAASFYADPDMLTTIIINLIDNALKYSPEDQPIHIDAREEQGLIVIEVRDRGMGIPQAELSKIGRRFFRASNVKTTTGTGLGIYSAHKLLAYHAGTLRLLSNAEGGTTAIVMMPSSNETFCSLVPEGMIA